MRLGGTQRAAGEQTPLTCTRICSYHANRGVILVSVQKASSLPRRFWGGSSSTGNFFPTLTGQTWELSQLRGSGLGITLLPWGLGGASPTFPPSRAVPGTPPAPRLPQFGGCMGGEGARRNPPGAIAKMLPGVLPGHPRPCPGAEAPRRGCGRFWEPGGNRAAGGGRAGGAAHPPSLLPPRSGAS